MAENTKIEWCDHTFNPWTGCTKVSPGCDHCYAEAWAKRSGTVTWGAGEPRRRTTPANWRLPLKWNRESEQWVRNGGPRTRVFCSSLADVFDNAVPAQWRVDLFNLIVATPHLDWLLLTKRVGNVAPMLRDMGPAGLPSNVWLGATVVNQEEADRDIPKLLAVPARVRFLSIEPMLGRLDVRFAFADAGVIRCQRCMFGTNILDHGPCPNDGETLRNDPGVNWVICGGESGPGARPMHPDWARSLRDQCAAAGVPFLFKQWGEHGPEGTGNRRLLIRADGSIRDCATPEGIAYHAPDDGGAFMYRVGKKAAGRLLDGIEHNGFPEA